MAKNFEKAGRIMETIKKLWLVSRPISWVNTAYPFAAGYYVLGGEVTIAFCIITLYFLGPYNLLMYGVNDVFDYESDIKNPRKGGVEGMREARALHPIIMRAVLITNVPFVVYILTLGTITARLIFLGLLFFVVAYSIAKLRFKEKPVLDSITSSIHFVGPLVYALALLGFPAVAWPYVIAFFFWGMASHAFGAVQDIVPDRAGKLQSIATVFGARITVWIAFVLYVVAASIVIIQGGWAIVVGVAGLAYAINIAPFLRVKDETSSATNKGWRRFMWLNYAVGTVVTFAFILAYVT